jgi:hypothetical protein
VRSTRKRTMGLWMATALVIGNMRWWQRRHAVEVPS